MSLAMDKALMALSLEEEDTPFVMPELPGFSSAEENKLSLIGRILNPHCQKMPALIMKMPRKWEKEGRVRGIALTPERFQFIFQSEHDLLDVLEKGVHTFNEWVIPLERWVENPTEDYLQYVPIWVQISNIPVNCYTTEALIALRDLVGKTKVVAFDPTKPITRNFIRVQVMFSVANPLRRSREISIKGETTTIFFHYERIQKRCFHRQRLIHERDYCPLVVGQRQEEARLRREKVTKSLEKKQKVIAEDDILYGVIDESMVGIDPVTGRCKMASDVLEEMRRYLLTETGESHAIKVKKIQNSLSEVSKNIMVQRSVMRLEAPPVITIDLNKGKGMVFDYSDNTGDSMSLSVNSTPVKLMADSFKAHAAASTKSAPSQRLCLEDEDSAESVNARLLDRSTVFKAGLFAPCGSRIIKKRAGGRRRPPKARRDQRKRDSTAKAPILEDSRREGKQEMSFKKRKCSELEEEASSTKKAVCLKVVPKEGLPNAQ